MNKTENSTELRIVEALTQRDLGPADNRDDAALFEQVTKSVEELSSNDPRHLRRRLAEQLELLHQIAGSYLARAEVAISYPAQTAFAGIALRSIATAGRLSVVLAALPLPNDTDQ